MYREVGTEVAKRNGYQFDRQKSRINTSGDKKRWCFTKNNGEQYISLDLESGGFEVFTGAHKSTHHGQYSFSCKYVKRPANKDHNLE